MKTEFINSIEFFKYCQELYFKLLEEQYPNLEQGCAFYSFSLEICEYLSAGKEFLKPGTLEYYSLNDGSIHISGVNDRLLFIQDMKNADNIFEFISLNSRGYCNEEHGLFWRRVPVWKNKKEQWEKDNRS